MKRSLWRDVVFAAAMVVFFGLLITGAPRLIAASEPEINETASYIHVKASLLCPPERAEQYRLTFRQDTRKAECLFAVNTDHGEGYNRLPMADANGNIVTHCSYMHAVYQTFALGDGFV